MYFNEFDKFAAQWLRNLWPEATVDECDIRDVQPAELAGFRECHFFGGIGGWRLALDIAGWPAERSVWSGSCPCQPFSDAGAHKAEADERHVWPEFLRLIAECRPATIFGEQVASRLGREWLAGVRTDLEAVGYEVGAADLCAAGVGAPHRRQRLYWVAVANGVGVRGSGPRTSGGAQGGVQGEELQRQRVRLDAGASGDAETAGMVNSKGGGGPLSIGRRARAAESKGTRGLRELGRSSVDNAPRLGDSPGAGPQEQWREYRPSGERCSGLVGLAMQAGVPQWNGPTVAVECSDGARRVSAQPDSFPLAHGFSKRVGKLRGAGNAIVPQLAATFIRAFLEATAPHSPQDDQ